MKITTVIAALTGLTLFSLGGPVQAQYKPKGDDGITASPRLRQFLHERKGISGTPSEPSNYQPMACTKCQDTTVTVRDNDPKGPGARTRLAGGPPTKRVAKHLCEGCGTDWKVVGDGKMKQSVATHKCTGCGAEDMACCNTTKGGTVVTKGMEKKNLKELNFEAAPLK